MTKGFCSVLRCVHRNTFEWENMPCWFREQPPGAARPGLPPGLLRAAAQGNRLGQPLGQPAGAAHQGCPPGQPTRTGLLMTNMVLVVVSFSVTQGREAVKLAEGGCQRLRRPLATASGSGTPNTSVLVVTSSTR